MVDKAQRDLARGLILRFMTGEMTNDQFEGSYPVDREDAALRAIAKAIWTFYDDMHEHRLTGKHALDDYGRKIFQRCALFLGTDLEYQWGDLVPWPGFLVQMVTLDVAGRRHLARLRSHGEYEVWPFRYRGDLDAVQSSASDELATRDLVTRFVAVSWWIYFVRTFCYFAFFGSAIAVLFHFTRPALWVFVAATAGLGISWVGLSIARREDKKSRTSAAQG
jgi:hypothetical protein